VTAVDLDPVLLEMGRATLGDAGGRLTWIEADLRDQSWADRLLQRPVQAVVSSTALHWLPLADLAATYRTAYDALAPGGVLLNADRFLSPQRRPTIWRALRQLSEARRERDLAAGGESWDAWWSALGAVREAQPLIAERTRRFAWFAPKGEAPSAEMHQAALVEAGFAEVDVVWQDLDARILAALKR
jgi:SAM-dependent methyltransferase